MGPRPGCILGGDSGFQQVHATAVAGARSGLLDDDDLAEAASAVEPGRAAAVIVYENAWAIPFVAAAQKMGAQLVASARIPADVVMEVLDAREAGKG